MQSSLPPLLCPVLWPKKSWLRNRMLSSAGVIIRCLNGICEIYRRPGAIAASPIFANSFITWDSGSFAKWAITEPYLRRPWRDQHPRNPYHENLRTFAQRWLND